MKIRLIVIMMSFALIIIIITGIFYYSKKNNNNYDFGDSRLVALNEIEQLAKYGQLEKMSEKTEELKENLMLTKEEKGKNQELIIMCIVCISFMSAVLLYIWFSVLRPFEKMKKFAFKIAEGNFDVPLNYERSNYFGKFTWAFDSMRREIIKARACEHEAIENNKTVIATLSHDIKTPVSSIRAYAEGLEANMDSTAEKRQRYIEVIISKCDEVSKLTNDLFLHSLADLDKLRINFEKLEVCGLVKSSVRELSEEKNSDSQNDIYFFEPDFISYVSADKNRLIQIIENIINNARKYAKSHIDVSIIRSEGSVEIHFRDYGGGIPDEDMPFIFDKFYRGRNSKNEQGSGLGLYIVKYIAEQMNGGVYLYNHSDGLEAVISLPLIIKET